MRIRHAVVSLAWASCVLSSFAGLEVEVSRLAIVDCGVPRLQDELKRHLDLLVGRSVPVVKPNQLKKSQFGFWIGRQRPVSTASELEALEEGEAPAKPGRRVPGQSSWEVTKDGAWIWGEVRRGLYHFLESEFDFEWPWRDVVWVRPQTEKVTFPVLTGEWVPPFAIRNIRPAKDETFILWSERLRSGRDAPPPEGHAFTSWWFRFCDDHPEFFGQRPDGVRAPYGVAAEDIGNALKVPRKQAEHIPLCTTSTSLVEQIVADWRKAGNDLNLCENDARPWEYCRCADCLALDGKPVTSFGGFPVGTDTWPGWRSDRYVHFARAVLARAAEFKPDVSAGLYAYNVSELPPQRERVPENLTVGLVPTHFTKEYVAAFVDGWKRAGLNRFYYRPNIRFYYRAPFIPMGYEQYLFDVQRLLFDRGGLVGFSYDGRAASSLFEYVQCWFLLRFMTDPTKDFAHWNERFCRCFGTAAPEARDYFAFWRAKWDGRIVPRLGELDGIGFNTRFYRLLPKLYPEEDWRTAEALLEKGLRRPDLGELERRLLADLKVENEQSRLFYRAWTLRTKEDVKALLDFRRANGRATIWGYEEKAFAGLLP